MQSLIDRIPARPVRCPCCRLRIDGRYVFAYRRCVMCGSIFTLRFGYVWTNGALGFVGSLGLGYALGNQGLGALLALPVSLGMAAVSLWLFPLDVSLAVPGWTPGDSDADREVEASLHAVRERGLVFGYEEPETANLPDTTPGRTPFSTPGDRPVSFEAIAVGFAFAVWLAYMVYWAVAG
jgi:hypothetical protein